MKLIGMATVRNKVVKNILVYHIYKLRNLYQMQICADSVVFTIRNKMCYLKSYATIVKSNVIPLEGRNTGREGVSGKLLP